MSSFLPENDLERVLMQITGGNPIMRLEFYRLLLESELFALGKAGQAAGPGAAQEIQIAQIEYKGRVYHPVFSSLTRMQNYLQGHPEYFSMKGRELFAAAKGAYFLLNPGAPYGKELLPEEIEAFLNPGPPAEDYVPLESLISQPVVFPQEIADALRELFVMQPEVEAAYLAEIYVAGTGKPAHPVMGVKTSGAWQPLAEEIGRVLDTLPSHPRVDAFRIVASGQGKRVSDALLRYEPFYTRKFTLH